MFNISWRCDNLICMFSVYLFHVPLQGSEKRNCGWWYQGCEIQSLQLYPFHFLPQNSGKCNCRAGGVIFVQICSISCTCGKSNYIFFPCRFPFPTSRHETMSVWGVGSLFNSCTCSTSHAPATIWQSDLRVFSVIFPCPTSRFGKMKLWVVV